MMTIILQLPPPKDVEGVQLEDDLVKVHCKHRNEHNRLEGEDFGLVAADTPMELPEAPGVGPREGAVADAARSQVGGRLARGLARGGRRKVVVDGGARRHCLVLVVGGLPERVGGRWRSLYGAVPVTITVLAASVLLHGRCDFLEERSACLKW